MRVGGAHLHLCFDGSEPPATLHLENDGGVHHSHEGQGAMAEVEHQDMDVALADDVLVKKSGLDFDFLALIAAAVFLLYSLPQLLCRLSGIELLVPVAAHRAHLRPPLRGPPSFASR